MSWTDPATLGTPEPNGIVASAWGQAVQRDLEFLNAGLEALQETAGSYAPTTAKCSMNQSGSTPNVGDNATHQMTNLNVIHDPGEFCNAAQGTYTCPIEGTYLFDCYYEWNATSGTNSDVILNLAVGGSLPGLRNWAMGAYSAVQSVGGAFISWRNSGDVMGLYVQCSNVAGGLSTVSVNLNVHLLSAPW
jgi:hypothetical protein